MNDAARERQLQSKYGISVADWQAMFEQQGGVCAICKRHQRYQRLAVDHSHKLAKVSKRASVRGLICMWCNRGLGRFVDSPVRLRAAAEYLENPPARELLQ